MFLASRKRCDFENAETLQFEIAPLKIAAFFFPKVWAPSTRRCCFTGKKHCDLEFAISKRSDLRFHSAIFLRSFAELAVRVATLNLRFENTAIAIVIFLGR